MGGKWYVNLLLRSLSYPKHLHLTSLCLQNVHAIGDRANGIVIDAFEAALTGVNVSALRPRLEHAQMMTDADMARLGKLGGGYGRLIRAAFSHDICSYC